MRKAKRIGAILLSALILITMMPVSAFAMGETDQEAQIATWEGWREAAATFTFDDGAPSHFESVAPLFDQYGYKATFYLVTGWGPKWSEFQALADKGFEIGSHSDSHGNNMKGEEASSKANIEKKITSKYGCITVAYPNCNVPNISAVKQNYIAGRIGNGSWQGLPDIMTKDGPSDWAKVPALMTGSETTINTTADFTKQIEKAIGQGGWVVFLTHGFAGKNNGPATYSPTSFDALEGTLNWANKNDDKVWVTSLGNAAMYVKERNASEITLESSGRGEFVYSLKHDIADDVCKYQYPLSVRVPIPSDWTSAEVTQDGESVDAYVKDGMAYFSAVPNGGDIVVACACKGKTDLGAHTLKTTVVKATFSSNGKKESVCTVCGDTIKAETIYAVKTCKLSDTALTYNGKAKKPSVIIKDSNNQSIPKTDYQVSYPSGRKNVGKYVVKVTLKGDYSGTKNLVFKINPEKTSLSSAVAGQNAIDVKWAKKKKVTGYEIQYSTKSNFKSGNKTVKVKSAKTTSKSIGKLKAGKKYYVRIRTYQKVKGVTYYSDWSAKKKVSI